MPLIDNKTEILYKQKKYSSSCADSIDFLDSLSSSVPMVIVVGNGHGVTSSNPRWDWLHFT